MATYLYQCPICLETEEVVHGMNEKPWIDCETCGFTMGKIVNAEYSGMTRKTSDNGLSDWENTKFR